MNTVELEQRQEGLFALVIIGGVLWWMSRRRQNGGGGGNGVIGPAQVGGGLGAIGLEDSVSLRTHLMLKVFGETITVRIPWVASTTDAIGNPINWRYLLVLELGHNTLAGWKNSGQLGFSESGKRTFSISMSLGTPGSKTSGATFTTPDDPDQRWDVQIKLFGARSDSSGVPASPTVWDELAFAEHPSALRSVDATVSIGGSIGTIGVSQERRLW